VVGAEAVHHHLHLHAPPGRGSQGLGQGLGGVVLMEDVGGQPDLVLRLGKGRQHRGKQLIAAAQQLHLIAPTELRPRLAVPGRRGGSILRGHGGGHRQAGSSSTSSGR